MILPISSGSVKEIFDNLKTRLLRDITAGVW
jgi:hypothetical protein